MQLFRLLIVSNTRPSRSWQFANRIACDVPGTQIWGIVQRPLQSIPAIQQQIAKRKIQGTPGDLESSWSKARTFFRSIVEQFIGSLLWFIHCCPVGLKKTGQFTVEKLIEKCAQKGWPVSVAPDGNIGRVLNSFRSGKPDLVVLLGEFSSPPELLVIASKGLILASYHPLKGCPDGPNRGTSICVEHWTGHSEESCAIASVDLKTQPYDGPLGFILKRDLIADDLLLQTTVSLAAENQPCVSQAVQKWADRVLTPCLSQMNGVANHTEKNSQGPKRCRSTWKLCLDALLLCSPWNVGRNWLRRANKQYPVLILAHHLVSDRPHRMGMTTEVFWRQVLYLQKHYRIVSLSEAAELLLAGAIRVPTVVLTFDDGYSDNFLGLRAVANEAGISPTLFITTGPVETQSEFDHDRKNGMKGFLPLTWEQIRYWNGRGVEFGSHTRTHFDCGSLDLENLRPEIMGSKNDLENHLGTTVEVFAFPYGKLENMSSEAMKLASSTYAHFVSSFGGEALSWKKEPRNHLCRKKFYESQLELELELQSVFDHVDAIKRRLRRGARPTVRQPLGESRPPLTPSIPSVNAQGSSATLFSPTKDL